MAAWQQEQQSLYAQHAAQVQQYQADMGHWQAVLQQYQQQYGAQIPQDPSGMMTVMVPDGMGGMVPMMVPVPEQRSPWLDEDGLMVYLENPLKVPARCVILSISAGVPYSSKTV